MRNTQTAQALQLFEWGAWALSWQFLSSLEPALVTTTMRMTMVSRPVVPTRLVTNGYRHYYSVVFPFSVSGHARLPELGLEMHDVVFFLANQQLHCCRCPVGRMKPLRVLQVLAEYG